MRTLACIAIGVICCAGCGGGPSKATLYPVKGKVTVGGKPLANCNINFTAAASAPNAAPQSYQGTTNDQGEYSLADGTDARPGAAVGKYKVSFAVGAKAAQEMMMKGGMKPGYDATAAPFPKEFSSAETSTKEVEVKAESNTINVEI